VLHDPDRNTNASTRSPSTHWSLIIRAGSPGSSQARAALAELCSVYGPFGARKKSATSKRASEGPVGHVPHWRVGLVLTFTNLSP
jgi:hypothetical protein